MTALHDPRVLAMQAHSMVFVKVLFVMGGIYIWEFFTSLSFELEILTGRRLYRWTIWLYSGCRLSALFAIVTILVGSTVTAPINCRTWSVMVLCPAFLTYAFASALIVLRVLAIWERKHLPCGIAITVWLVNIAFDIHNMIGLEAIWDAERTTCFIRMALCKSISHAIISLGQNAVLLSLMFIGLRRYKNPDSRGLWHFIRRQGLIWLALVMVAEAPTTIFMTLDLSNTSSLFTHQADTISSEYFNLMCYAPELIVIAIGASRIYRSLAEYHRKMLLARQIAMVQSLHDVVISR